MTQHDFNTTLRGFWFTILILSIFSPLTFYAGTQWNELKHSQEEISQIKSIQKIASEAMKKWEVNNNGKKDKKNK